jgi:hypothetical protein
MTTVEEAAELINAVREAKIVSALVYFGWHNMTLRDALDVLAFQRIPLSGLDINLDDLLIRANKMRSEVHHV